MIGDPRTDPSILLAPIRERFDDVLARIEELVNIDSGSFTAEGVNRIADLCQTHFEAGGWEVERHRHHPNRDGVGRPVGDLVVGRRAGRRSVVDGGRRMLLLAHMDTVFDDGTAAERPFQVRDSRGYGPGVTDDKAGVVCGIEAVEVLCNLTGFDDFASITLVCSPDEEIGSPFSRPLITALANEHDVALGLEAARTNGALVSARKGISAFTIEVEGKAVHAGVRPAEGVNAVLEAAHKTVALHALNGRWPEVTCNVGVLQGGRRTNVVADRAVMQVEVRAATTAAFGEAMDEVARIVATTTVPGARARLLPAHRHPPMERTPAVAALVAVAQGSPGTSGSTLARRPPAELEMPTPRRPPACLRSTAWPRWAATRTGPTSGSTSTVSCPARPCWPGFLPGWGPELHSQIDPDLDALMDKLTA